MLDLSRPSVPLPARIVCDTNVLLDWLGATPWLAARTLPPRQGQGRGLRLVERFQREDTVGLVTSTSLNELFHFVLKVGYRREVADFRDELLAHYPNVSRPDWLHLFKARSDLVRRFATELDRVRSLMNAANILVLQPDDLGPIPSGRALEDELVRTMERFELDSNDAAILIEARRAGVSAIATLDRDLRRAGPDFDVYTWL